MSKRTQDMAKLRRKLEQSSRKTRRSTDLRRSLGRKSVGDNCDTASFEQASFSNSTLNESCHLNTDSAIIDPGIAENPEWFKVVPADIQAREESILAARQKERDAEESNDSNLSHFNISIDQRKIQNVFDCSVLVSRESIDRHINRNPINVDESIGSSAVENLSTELPKRRLNTLRRGLKKRSGKAFYTELRKALEDSEEEGDEPQRENRKSNLKKVQENLTADRHSKTSNIESPFDDEGELPKRKPNSLSRGPRKRTEKSLEKELGEALEDSELSDESAEPPSKRDKSNSKKIDEIKSATMKSQPSNPVSFNGNDSSFEVPKRKPNTLRRELREKSRKSFENALKLALENSGVSDESMQSSKGNPENNSKEMPEDVITTIQTRASKLVSFHGNDSSIELPKRKHNTLGKELRSKSRKSFEVALRKALEESGHSDESMDVSKENPQNTSKEMPENVPTSTQSQPSNPLSIHGNDSSLEIPKRRPNTLRRGMKERSRKSFEDALKFALEDSGQSNDTITSPHHSQTSELGDKENVPNIKITKPLKDSEDDIGSKSLSMPLGAEACNMDGLSDVIAPNKKSLSLGKKRISKECDFSVVVEVSEPEPSQDNGLSDVIAPNRKSLSLGKKRISKECDFSEVVEVSEPKPSQDKAPQLQGNLNLNFVESRITENCIQSPEDSVTDTTRHVPISIANAELIQHAQTPLDSINRSKNLSVRSGKSVQPAPEVTLSFLELPERNRLQESVLSEIMPVNVGVSMESGMQLDKSGTVLSQQSFQAVNASPLSTQESLHPRRISNSFQDKPVDENLEKQSRKTVKNSDIYDEESCHSSASTFSLASDTIISDSVFQKPLSNLGKKSDFETATTASQVIETTESDSVFKRTSSNAEKHSHLETSTNFSQIIESVGSDSVFTRTSGNSRKMKSLENQTEHFSTNKSITSCVPDASEDNNDKGTKISLPNGACDSLRSTSPQPLQEDSSTSPFDSDVSEEGYANEGETSDQSEKLLVISPLTELPDPPTSRPVSSSAPISQTSECHNDRHSGFNQSVVGQKNVASIMPNSVKQNVGKKALFKGQPKKLTEPELEKMRLGLKNWMDEIRREVHTTVAESQPVLAPKTTPFEKPKKSAPKAAAKKKEPDPYFGDYRPPKRVKPRPYVTDKMYKFLEKRLKDKFGLEARIKAEEFVRLMCNLVQNTIKEKNAKKYHPMVFKLRNEMVKLGLIKTQFDYHLFIEDYLPDAFRVKSIPCYGCSKGPTLDVDDLYSDLSIK